MTENYPVNVLRVGADLATSELAREVLALAMPDVPFHEVSPSQAKQAGPGDVVLVCEPTRETTLATLRLLRASGYAGGVLLVATIEADTPDLARFAPARAVHPNALSEQLSANVCELAKVKEDSPARQSLLRTRRLVAAGEIALSLQHSINNPLTALLAEAQLLELDELSTEHREAVERIITQTRRVIDLVKSLDGVSERKRS